MTTCDKAKSLVLGLPRSSEDGKFVPQNLIIEKLLPEQKDVIKILSCPCQGCKNYRNLARRGPRDALHEKPQLEHFSGLILKHAVSFFALLVSLKKGVLIIPFLRKERFDRHVLDALADRPSKCARRSLDDVLDDDAIKDLDNEIELHWTTFLRPFLSGAKDKVFPERQLLPTYDSRQIDKGASSRVYIFKVYTYYSQIDVGI